MMNFESEAFCPCRTQRHEQEAAPLETWQAMRVSALGDTGVPPVFAAPRVAKYCRHGGKTQGQDAHATALLSPAQWRAHATISVWEANA